MDPCRLFQISASPNPSPKGHCITVPSLDLLYWNNLRYFYNIKINQRVLSGRKGHLLLTSRQLQLLRTRATTVGAECNGLELIKIQEKLLTLSLICP